LGKNKKGAIIFIQVGDGGGPVLMNHWGKKVRTGKGKQWEGPGFIFLQQSKC